MPSVPNVPINRIPMPASGWNAQWDVSYTVTSTNNTDGFIYVDIGTDLAKKEKKTGFPKGFKKMWETT